MKLCYIADANSVHTRRWITPFIEEGNQVYLISYAPAELPWTGLEELVDLTQLTNVKKLRFAYWGWWIRRYVRQIQPDILHAHQLTGAGWLGVMANYHPFIVSGWGSDILVEPYKSSFRKLLINAVLNQSDALTVPSKIMYDAAQPLNFPKTKLHLIPWGVETSIFKPTPDDRFATRKRLGLPLNAKIIFSPRGINRIYNLDVLIEAVSSIITQAPDLQLVLLEYNVDATYLAQLKQKILSYNLKSFVYWLPAVRTHAEMAQLYRMADVTVSIPMSEGYGFTVYEAIASGCPTIISDLPVFEGGLENGIHTIKVPVQDTDSTSQALLNLLTSDTLHFSLRRNALEICKTKSATTRIEQTKILYQTVMTDWKR